MLKIVEHTPNRLVLQDRHTGAVAFAGCFTLVSALSLVMLGVQGVDSLILHDDQRDLLAIRLIGFGVFLLIGAGFLMMAVGALLHFWHGITCVFDKDAEVMTLHNMKLFRRDVQSWPIYGVSHLDAEFNADIRVYGLFVVLRSGERIPIATVPMIDEAHAQELKRQVRGFLRG